MNFRDDRVLRAYNLHLIDDLTPNVDGFPVLDPVQSVDVERMCDFTQRRNCRREKTACHFYLDDFRFNGTWSQPERYIDTLQGFECVLTPDFSCYLEMLEPMQMWNVYRGRAVGRVWQERGLCVVPTLTWGESNTYAFCFKGLSKGGTVALSTVGLMDCVEGVQLFQNGANEACKQLEPVQVLAYGKQCDFNARGAKVQWFENEHTQRLRGIDGRFEGRC